MAKMAKRLSEEFQEVSEMLCEPPNAKIHAVVESLLPISVPLFLFTLSSTITLRLLLLHFGSHTIFFGPVPHG